ncbi:General stress protein CsbA [Paenisporosarcina quisquiliarum]|jgi:general stress protein CsbA|uniref:CsbA family protein n=1 Tax=Psychrobacillus psychrodurans TaxID=126157 RepID=A0A9X3L5G1_9BACI|nr:CsbA family protein [Psychrobacillus psychrodurans]SEM30865.1 General stress protein CsbA [Paenisporosarcina quisquiliarum]MCK1996022.1 CsbA family protein [Psychrobacillus psychrodurans]MCZ8531758.1 CsbA family protein [Psychrobacillus psychrodurans]MCZ8539258.1 CsbA family protein [Psychrobacillus psychrodurans]SFM35067.1 General stress protein CsbA [Psychrobacillus psychrodurans]
MESLSLTTQIILAIFAPAALVVLFTRITFNHYVALILTVALFAASVYAGYTHRWWIYMIDAASLTIGFWYSTHMKTSKNKKNPPL